MSRSWVLGIAVALSGCSTLDRSVAESTDAKRGAVEARVPMALPFAVSPVRADSFAALFEDALLSVYLDRALAANTDLAGARARLAGAEARLAQARASRGPRVSADASAGVATLVSDFDLNDNAGAGLGVAYDPDVFGRLRANVRGAEARRALQAAELARLQRVILARTVQAYIATIAADAQLELARENFEFLGETLRVSRARFEAGDTSRADFALSEAEYENARASLAAQELGARETRRALASLIGAFADEELPVAETLPRVGAAGIGLMGGADRAVLTRWDVEASRLGVVSAVASVDAVQASTLPSFSITGGVSGGLELSDLFDIDTYVARLSAAVSDVIFDNGLDAARITEAETGIDAALAAYEASAREAYRELVSGFDRAENFEARLAALDAASVAAERALELENIRFDLGEAILLDVLTVQRRVNFIQSDRIRTESGYLQAVADAHLAAGPALAQ